MKCKRCGEAAIRKGTYATKTKGRVQRYACKGCGFKFTAATGSKWNACKLTLVEREQVIATLLLTRSMRKTAKLTRHKRDTVRRIADRVGLLQEQELPCWCGFGLVRGYRAYEVPEKCPSCYRRWQQADAFAMPVSS